MKSLNEMRKEDIGKPEVSMGVVGAGGYFGRFYANHLGGIISEDPTVNPAYISEMNPIIDGKPNGNLSWALDRFFDQINPREYGEKTQIYYADFVGWNDEEKEIFEKDFNWTEDRANLARFHKDCELVAVPIIKDIKEYEEIAKRADVVAIVTPTPTHYELASYLGEVGTKKIAFDDTPLLVKKREMTNLAPEKPATQTKGEFEDLLRYGKITTNPIEVNSPEMQALINAGKVYGLNLEYSAHYRESEINEKLKTDPKRSISDDPFGDKLVHDFNNFAKFLDNTQGHLGNVEIIESKINGLHVRKRPGEESCLIDRNENPIREIDGTVAAGDAEIKLQINNQSYNPIIDLRGSWDGIPEKLEKKLSDFLGSIYPRQGDELRTTFWLTKPPEEDKYLLGITNTLPPKDETAVQRYLVFLEGEKLDEIKPMNIDDVLNPEVYNWNKEEPLNIKLDNGQDPLRKYIKDLISWTKGEAAAPISTQTIYEEMRVLGESRDMALGNYLKGNDVERYIGSGLADKIKVK